MYNLYCDESCHLPNDDSDVMVLGAIKCNESKKIEIYNEIRKIKEKHGISSWAEVKWTKVSLSKLKFYKELVDYFFNNQDLTFRCTIAPGKKELDHVKYNNGNYDEWYYKMYYHLLLPIIKNGFYPTGVKNSDFRVFIDIKDTKGGPKVKKLKDVLIKGIKKDNLPGLSNEIFLKDINQINSRESELLQLADLLIGMATYYHRGLYFSDKSSKGKQALIEYCLLKHKIILHDTTPLNKTKFNVFVWRPQKGDHYEIK
ncbi:DUF3800 domain-containing protein [Neobacillus sp. OS1-33]|uniref:DUF3800 domain-containing protein n=1 Tax=Neobacillus sp. OS1-33 TaxID=3070683 RepID=UPI0027E003D2|nr:DUF3800 domain-containing protein [Neobacillus sp. OS1-33]WML26272.1 DUF3800 domain-containing protein [Neobacillus sp. OS1-33]